MVKRINQWFSMPELFILYWALYWFMNGLDKFVNRTDLGFFIWHGKNRMEQFGGYFSDCGLSEQWITPLLYLIGIWEFIIFAILTLVLWARFIRSEFAVEWFKFGMCLGGLTFVIFSFFDVIFGDRAELLEHGNFLILIAVSYQFTLSHYSGSKDQQLS